MFLYVELAKDLLPGKSVRVEFVVLHVNVHQIGSELLERFLAIRLAAQHQIRGLVDQPKVRAIDFGKYFE